MPETRPQVGLILVAVALALALGGGAWYGNRHQPVPPPAAGGGVVTTLAADILVVHVSGAVRRPGLVTLAPGSRIADAVSGAGGATSEAELGGLNLAATVRDGDQITVPGPGEGGTVSADSSTTFIDLNRASASDLEQLPGVGPVLAARIVAFREQNGPFGEIEGLLDVDGIGEAKLAAMRDQIAPP